MKSVKVKGVITAILYVVMSVCGIFANEREQKLSEVPVMEPGELICGEYESLDGWYSEGGAITVADGAVCMEEMTHTRAYQDVALEAGYYDITARVYLSSCEGICYMFADGEGYTEARTAVGYTVPGGERLIHIRGAATDGNMKIGIDNDGVGEVKIYGIEIKKTAEQSDFLQGGDVTMLNYVIANGGEFRNASGALLYNYDATPEQKARAVMMYLAERGMNTVRIRLSNNPGKDSTDPRGAYYLPDGFQDLDDCLKLAEYATDAGLKVLWTFNYSDYWSNAECQMIPSDWEKKVAKNPKKAVDILEECISEYTEEVMKELAKRGVYPEIVSLGNETTGGYLFPYGYAFDITKELVKPGMPEGKANPEAIARFVNAGYDAVKSVSPDTKVAVHMSDCTEDYSVWGKGAAWWLWNLRDNGGKFDVIGISYYPAWSRQTTSVACEYAGWLAEEFGKEVVIMETGYNWNSTRRDGFTGQLTDTAEEYKLLYPYTRTGQKGYMTEALNAFKGVEKVIGCYYWDPVMIHVEDEMGINLTGWAMRTRNSKPAENVVENYTLFDFEGTALPALGAFEYNCKSYPLN